MNACKRAFEQRHIDRTDILTAAALCGVDDETALLAADAFERERAFCEKYAPRCARKFCPRLLRKPPIVRLACVLAATTCSRERYRELGIGDDVFAATMSDIGIWTRNCRVRDGVVGIVNYPWVSHHLTLRLFRIGRLQFQFFKLYCPLGAIARLRQLSPPHALGENILNVRLRTLWAKISSTCTFRRAKNSTLPPAKSPSTRRADSSPSTSPNITQSAFS